MNELIRTVYILHTDGVPILSVDPDSYQAHKTEPFINLFGGLSNVINTLLSELGHSESNAVTINGILVYSLKEPYLFVVHVPDSKYEHFGKILVKQIEYEFHRVYNGTSLDKGPSLDIEQFKPFEVKIKEIHNTLTEIQTTYPEILSFLPSFVPLFRLNEALNMGHDIVSGYPFDTIKFARQLGLFFADEEGLEETIALTLGRYSGSRISRMRYPDEISMSQDNVLELLNEISVTKYDKQNEIFDVVLCPICREKTAETHMCHFFSGFIEGALNNPRISVKEIACKAAGDMSCQFKLQHL
ncbi:MAG: hypothetical protein P1Q69_09970 [Candidatus Thorarchaeota archaeon]|nr:hypothetical protein [Candidatus Thorarchaeota archaeon]